MAGEEAEREGWREGGADEEMEVEEEEERPHFRMSWRVRSWNTNDTLFPVSEEASRNTAPYRSPMATASSPDTTRLALLSACVATRTMGRPRVGAPV